MNRRKKLLILIVVLAITIILVLPSLKRPPQVIIGPIDIGIGIPGVIDNKTTRPDVIRLVGPPARVRETVEEAERRGDSDPRPDYFTGIYAEVYFDNTETARGINIDLDDFYKKYRQNLKVLTRNGVRVRELSRETQLKDVKKPEFTKSLGYDIAKVKYNGASVYFLSKNGETAMCLGFSYEDGHLQDVGFNW